MKCNLCKAASEFFYTGRYGDYYKCLKCKGVFLAPQYYLDPRAEKARYETHNNDVNDKGYQQFVSPIVNKIASTFSSDHLGLDFGCGTGPVIHHMLKEKGIPTDLYDPFFKNDKSVFSKKYDFIICCEVMEHFHHPTKEFRTLYDLLNPKGKLYCMTDLLYETLNFDKWYYKEDHSHVFFYHPNTIAYIQENVGFSKYQIENRLIIFEKEGEIGSTEF